MGQSSKVASPLSATRYFLPPCSVCGCPFALHIVGTIQPLQAATCEDHPGCSYGYPGLTCSACGGPIRGERAWVRKQGQWHTDCLPERYRENHETDEPDLLQQGVVS